MPRPASVGSASVNATALAAPEPSDFTVIVKPTGLPARTLCASAVLVTLMWGVLVRQMPSRSVRLMLPLVTVAVLSRLAVWPLIWIVQSASWLGPPAAGAVVGEVTWTDAEAPGARSPKLQVRVLAAMVHLPAGLLEATLHAMP